MLPAVSCRSRWPQPISGAGGHDCLQSRGGRPN